MEQKGNSACGAACVALAGILWGILGLFVRALGDSGLTPFDVVGVRALVAAGALLLFLLATDRRALLVRPRDLWCFLGTGLCSIVFFNYCYFTAVRMMSLASAAVLLYTAPAGVLIGLGAGLGYALYTIFGRYALARGYQAPTITFYTFLIAALCVCLADGTARLRAAAAAPEALALMLALGLVSTVAPFLLYTIGLRTLSGARASIIASIEPVTAAFLGIALYGEQPGFGTLLGLLLVLLGIFLARKA